MLTPRSVSQDHGSHGEERAAEFLRKKKYKIIHKNYKTPRYEIDIIAKRKRCLHFVEVKFRSSEKHGKGYEYVTPAKLKQMTYAAECWVSENNYSGNYQLLVVSVDGDTIRLIDDIWQ